MNKFVRTARSLMSSLGSHRVKQPIPQVTVYVSPGMGAASVEAEPHHIFQTLDGKSLDIHIHLPDNYMSVAKQW